MFDLLLALIEVARVSAPEALMMDALFGICLLAARGRQNAAAAAAASSSFGNRQSAFGNSGGGGWTTHSDGARTRHIRSMEDLRTLLKGGLPA